MGVVADPDVDTVDSEEEVEVVEVEEVGVVDDPEDLGAGVDTVELGVEVGGGVPPFCGLKDRATRASAVG